MTTAAKIGVVQGEADQQSNDTRAAAETCALNKQRQKHIETRYIFFILTRWPLSSCDLILSREATLEFAQVAVLSFHKT